MRVEVKNFLENYIKSKAFPRSYLEELAKNPKLGESLEDLVGCYVIMFTEAAPVIRCIRSARTNKFLSRPGNSKLTIMGITFDGFDSSINYMSFEELDWFVIPATEIYTVNRVFLELVLID